MCRRVGFAHAKETADVLIPSNVADLYDSFDVVQVDKVAPEWDFMWNAIIEEGREKKLKRAVLSRCPEEFPPRRQSESGEVVLAEATLKVRGFQMSVSLYLFTLLSHGRW